MLLKDAIEWCHVRSAVYRTSKPEVKYWKNSCVGIIERVPFEDRDSDDWEEYDPRDNDDCSLFMFND